MAGGGIGHHQLNSTVEPPKGGDQAGEVSQQVPGCTELTPCLADEETEIQSSGELSQAWPTAPYHALCFAPLPLLARPLPRPVASPPRRLYTASHEKKCLCGCGRLSSYVCRGKVRLFPRVLIRKLPGSPFSLSFFLLLRWACRAGASEKRWLVVGNSGGGGRYSPPVFGGGDGDKGSAPQVTGRAGQEGLRRVASVGAS